jgi:uncharacterized protein YukE
MGPGEIVDWAKAAAVAGGVFGGLCCVFAVAWVWFKHHVWGFWAGLILCFSGTVLVIGPLYKQISFVSDGQRLELKLGELERELARTRTALDDTNKKYAEVAATWQRIGATPSQVTKLQQDIDQLVTKVNQASAQVNQVNAVSESALEHWRALGFDAKPRPNSPSNTDPQIAPYLTPQPQQPNTQQFELIPGR